MSPAPPLQFLGLVAGGWICLRAAMLVPGWPVTEATPREPRYAKPEARLPPTAIHPLPAGTEDGSPVAGVVLVPRAAQISGGVRLSQSSVHTKPRLVQQVSDFPIGIPFVQVPRPHLPGTSDASAGPSRAQPVPLASLKPAPRRWSASAWALARPGASPALAAAGTLGGSQLGARLSYRMNGDISRPLSLSLRAYSPLREPEGSEAAVGVEWQPVALPVRLLAERRQALGRRGRSAFALMVFGGVGDQRLGPLRLDAYGQGGVVGAERRDLFVDGSAVLAVPLDGEDRLRIGAGAWGAAQPGVSRLDVGPRLSFRVPLLDRNVTLAADWRWRVAGDASPGSGPALTISTDF